METTERSEAVEGLLEWCKNVGDTVSRQEQRQEDQRGGHYHDPGRK